MGTRMSFVKWSAAAVALLAAGSAGAQVFVVGSFDPRLAPQPYKETSIALSPTHLDGHTRLEIIRIMNAETAFTMRAIPLGHKGITVHANGKVTPDGSDYQKEVMDNGVSVAPGGKATITDVRIESDRIVFDVNGGPDKKHHWLQHIQLGNASTSHSIAPDTPDATGGRITLLFHGYVPEMTGADVKALLRPVLDFSIKSPLEAYTDTLPPKIKTAVLEHRVLVGMDRDMVLYALSQPDRKLHEQGGDGALYDEWIYGTPPHIVQMVRFEGDRVVQVELAAIGKEPIIRNTDETDGYLAKRGDPAARPHDVLMGDSTGSGNRPPPSLRLPGEPVPDDAPKPVIMPPGVQNIAQNLAM